LKRFTAINPEIHDDSPAFSARTVGLKGNGAEGGLFEKGMRGRDSHPQAPEIQETQ
jgi:hypothetical protein